MTKYRSSRCVEEARWYPGHGPVHIRVQYDDRALQRRLLPTFVVLLRVRSGRLRGLGRGSTAVVANVVLLTVLLALARSIEWLGFLHGPGGYYSVCAPIFNFLPYCIFTGAAVVAAQQKAKLVKQLESFSANDTTCSAPRDRQEVEGAIARCFPSLARFEEAFREDGTAHARIMDHIKAQPGLLRVQDLCLALGIVWTLNAFDFMTFSSRIYGSGCLWTVLIALPSQVAAFLTHAKLVEALSLSTRLPAWLSVVMFSPLPIILVVPIMFPLSWAWIALRAARSRQRRRRTQGGRPAGGRRRGGGWY